MKKYSLLLLIVFLTGCAKTLMPIPAGAIPEIIAFPDKSASYGQYPKDYQKILQQHLKKQFKDTSKVKVEFVNKPKKIAVETLTGEFYGYRICVSLEDTSREYHKDTRHKNHFFLIRNSKIKLHLFDSGLLKIPFELCVDRRDRGIYLEDIPEQPAREIDIDTMDDPSLIQEPAPRKERRPITYDKDIFISCEINDNEHTYVFNEAINTLHESIGMDLISFETVEFSKTHILGRSRAKEVLINRVSGSIFMTDDNITDAKGSCELLDKKKF